MDLQEKAVVMGESEIGRTLVRIAHEIVEKNKGVAVILVVVGFIIYRKRSQWDELG